MAKNKEIRNITDTIKRSSEDSRLVEGVAVVFNSDSQDLGFIETIDPQAITEETIRNSDIFATLEAPHTQLGDELLEYLSRGEITTSSFAFVVDQNDGDEWFRDEENHLRRHIKKIYRLYDVSPVFEPAYLDTDCSKRKFEQINEIDKKLDKLREEFETI